MTYSSDPLTTSRDGVKDHGAFLGSPKPLVSVVIPTYNRAGLIDRSLESAFAQTYDNLEVIVVDDGSTDNTEEVLPSTWGDRIRYHRQENQGAGAARNTGIGLAQGEFVAFLDSDDEWSRDKIEKQVELFQSIDDPRLGIVLCGREKIYRNRAPVYDIQRPQLQGNAFEQLMGVASVMGASTSAILAHRKVFESGIKFDSQLPAIEDWDFLLTASRHFSFRTVPEVLVINHREDGGEHVHEPTRIRVARMLILEKYRDELQARPEVAASHHRVLAGLSHYASDMSGIREHMRTAQRLDPFLRSAVWTTLSRLSLRPYSFAADISNLARRTLIKARLRRFSKMFEVPYG